MFRRIKGFRTSTVNLAMEYYFASMPFDHNGCHATGTAKRSGGQWWAVYQDKEGYYFLAR